MHSSLPGRLPNTIPGGAPIEPSRAAFLASLTEATAGAKTREGLRVLMLHEERDGALVTTYRVLDEGGETRDTFTSSSAFWPGEVDRERMVAFLEGIRRAVAAFDRAWVDAGAFVPIPLLEVRSLVAPDDFARAVTDGAVTEAAEAETFAEDLIARRSLPMPPADVARLIHRLDALEHVGLDETAANTFASWLAEGDARRPYAFALLDLWATRGLSSDSPAALRIAERLYWAVERRASLAERMRLLDVKDRLCDHGVFGTGASPSSRGASA